MRCSSRSTLFGVVLIFGGFFNSNSTTADDVDSNVNYLDTTTQPLLKGCNLGQSFGCFKNPGNFEGLGGTDDNMSPNSCAALCQKAGASTGKNYILMAITFADKTFSCSCDTSKSAKGDSATLCYKECPGDSSSQCGGDNQWTEYAFSCDAPPNPPPSPPPTPPPPSPPPGPGPPSPPPPAPLPTPPGTKHKKAGPIGYGTLSMIVAVGLLFPYCLIGGIVKRQKYHARGMEMVPNKGFWALFFGLVHDGAAFTMYKIKGKCCGGPTGAGRLYESF